MRKIKKHSWLLLIVVLVSCTLVRQSPTPSPTTPPIFTLPLPTSTETRSTPATSVEKTLDANRSDFEAERLALVSNSILSMGIDDPDVIRTMQTVPRHLFVPDDYVRYAYLDLPLPIGFGQTISQPYMVAWMTEMLELEPGDKVLEIGTGSGYQAAVLAEIGSVEVYSIEIVPELAEQGKENIIKAGYEDVHLKQDDGYYGWEEHAPFDAIIVTAAPDHMPLPRVDQLDDGGFLVIPIGPPGWYQTLWRVSKVEGEVVAENLGSVAFVPFTGEGASSQQP
jgi:protein-L-isoaspartate(D-aspartate) O-methyltransferase